MIKLFTLLANVVFIVNYGISIVVFNYFLNHYDFGEWNNDGWDSMLVGGMISGVLALLFELRLYRKLEIWPKSLFLFLARQIFCGIVFITLGFMIASSITIVRDLIQSPSDVLWFVVLPLMTALYLPMLIPFGIVAGLINGILFRVVQTLQIQNSLLESPSIG